MQYLGYNKNRLKLFMDNSIFRAEALTQKKKGDNKTQESFKILRLPSKLLLYSTTILAISAFIWACLAKIPINQPGAAVVFDIDNSTVLGAGTSGKIIIIPERFRKKNKLFFDKVFRIQQNPDRLVSVNEAQDILNTMLKLSNLNMYNKLGREYTTAENLKNISLGTKYYETGDIIAVIYSDSSLQELLNSMTKSISQYIQNNNQYAISQNMQNSYQKILNTQNGIINIFQKLASKQYVSTTDLLTQRSQAVSLKSQISQSKSQAIEAAQQTKLAEQSINSTIREFIGEIFILCSISV